MLSYKWMQYPVFCGVFWLHNIGSMYIFFWIHDQLHIYFSADLMHKQNWVSAYRLKSFFETLACENGLKPPWSSSSRKCLSYNDMHDHCLQEISMDSLSRVCTTKRLKFIKLFDIKLGGSVWLASGDPKGVAMVILILEWFAL